MTSAISQEAHVWFSMACYGDSFTFFYGVVFVVHFASSTIDGKSSKLIADLSMYAESERTS
jgi:hypothetical protein